MASAAISIAAAEQRLQSAYFGLEDMEKRPEQRFYSGLMNAVVFARMVTLSLQNMRSDVPEWQDWYEPRQQEMKNDPSMKFFVDLRNLIEKTASNTVAMKTHIKSFSSSDMSRFQPRPPGAQALVIASVAHGGASGWEIENPDGSKDFYAVELPKDIGETTMHFIGSPENLAAADVRDVIREHLGKLSALVIEARKQFL